MLQPIRNYLKQNSKFLDTLRIHVRGGAGGFGFPRYGGEGGKGGDVCLVAKEGIPIHCFITSIYSLK